LIKLNIDIPEPGYYETGDIRIPVQHEYYLGFSMDGNHQVFQQGNHVWAERPRIILAKGQKPDVFKPLPSEPEEPSETFIEQFRSGHGGCRIMCECGRTFYDASNDGGWDWEEGEFQELEARTRKDPDECIGVEWTVSTTTIEGKEYVIGCPCNIPSRYERFLKRHPRQIATYINRCARKRLEKAASIAKSVRPDIGIDLDKPLQPPPSQFFRAVCGRCGSIYRENAASPAHACETCCPH
jgi:hypothetical protein